MKQSKKERISFLISQLAKIPVEQRESIALELGIRNPEGHELTARNQCLIYFQNMSDVPVSIVAGYRQWQKYGRQVKKGSSGFLIAVPAGSKSDDEDETGEVYFIYKTVFDIMQTEEIKKAAA